MNICIYAEKRLWWARHTRRATTHSDLTGGGGLEPAAANTGLWDLVPHSPVHRDRHALCGRHGPSCAEISTIAARERVFGGRFRSWKRRTRPDSVEAKPAARKPASQCKKAEAPMSADCKAGQGARQGGLTGHPRHFWGS